MFYNGHGVRQDFNRAISLFEEAAEGGLAEAAFNLGVMYQNGVGVEASDERSVEWFYRAGQIYLSHGMREPASEAASAIESSIAGHPLAQKLLAEIYGDEE